MVRSIRSLVGAVAIAVFGFARGAVAQEVTDTVIHLPPVDVRIVISDNPVYTPGAASILSREAIERLRPTTLHDALRLVPGIRTLDDDVLGLRSGIGIRGAPPRRSRKTLLLEDGSPINGSTYLDPSAHYTPPMERLERLEVLRGAGQLVHGPLNNYGVVNFRNLRPTATPETKVEIGGGETGIFNRHALHSRSIGPAGILLSYTGMNANGAFDVERHQFDDFFGSVSWDLGVNHGLTSTLTYFRERSDGYDESNLTPSQFETHPRGKAVLDQGREFNNISVDYLKADLSYDGFVLDRVRISSKLFLTELDRPRFQTRGVAPTDGGVMEGRDRLYRTAGVELRAEFPEFRLLGLRQAWQGGVRHEEHRFRDARPVGLPGEALRHGARGNVFAQRGVDGYTRDGRLVTYRAPGSAAYLQSALRGPGWTVTPGIRLESYRQTRTIDFWPGADDEGDREAQRNTLLLPGISFLYHDAQRVQVYAGVHRGFAPASARTEEFPLVPETGVNAQVGLRAEPAAGLALDVAVFHNRIRNTLIRDDVDVFGDALFINAADSRAFGVDLSTRVGTASRTGSAYDVFGELAYNLTDAAFTDPPLRGNRVPEIPRHVGSFTGGIQRMDRWHVSATLTHFGDFYADKENTANLRVDGGRVPRRTLLSGRMSFSPSDPLGLTVWLQGRNLTNRLYVSDVQDGLRPGAPRSVTAGVTFQF
jgi:Fe(3+) dicitrate transport protein